jgi:hypothetical protein
MKRAVALLGLGLILFAGVAVAQQPQAQPSPERGHHHMQGGMCPMMGSMMGGGMMGMMRGQPDARTMQMRGEMMKAMGDIMMKYGKAMEGSGR